MVDNGPVPSKGKESDEPHSQSGHINPYDSAWIPPQLGQYNCPLSIFLGANYHWRQVAVGALVFDERNRLLILQRSAEDPAFPNRWKIPGGSVEEEDPTVLCAVGRVLDEETRLNVSLIVRQVGPGIESATGIAQVQKRRVKFSFEVEVAELPEVGIAGRINRVPGLGQQRTGEAAPNELPVKLDPAKHQRYLWVSENEVRRSNYNGEPLEFMSLQLRRTLSAGFAIRRKDYGRAFLDLLPLNETDRSTHRDTDSEVWRQEIQSGYYMTKNWDKFDASFALEPDP